MTGLFIYFNIRLVICKDGMHDLAALLGDDEINLAACHMLDSSKPSSQLIQCSALAILMLLAYLLHWER